MGRPTLRTPELVDEILSRLSSGEPLAQICREEGKPHPNVWRDWCAVDESLAIAYARAREDGFDRIAADCLEIANTPLEGQTVTTDKDGVTIKREDMLGHRKLQIETRLKLLAKWDPKRFGEKVQHTGGDGDGPIQIKMTAIDEAL